MLVASVAKWAFHLQGAIEIFEVIVLSLFVAALVSCLISPPDPAFITPLVLVGAFAKERARMQASRAGARSREIHSAAMLAAYPANGFQARS
jgi:hypothetical protein